MIETGHARDDAAARAGLLALQRDARADRGDAARPRRAGHRPAGRRHAHLHLHLHDGQLPASPRAKHGVKVDRLRSAESDRRHRGRRADARATASSRSSGMYPIPMRHGMTIGELARLFNEHFGIGADLEVVADGGLAPRRCITTRPACRGCMPSPNMPTARQRHRLSGHGAVRRHERVGRPRHDAAVRAGRRAVGRRGAVRRRAEPARAAGRRTSGRRCSSRRSTSTPGPAAAAARFT